MSVCLDALAWLDGEQPALQRIDELIETRPVVLTVDPDLIELRDPPCTIEDPRPN